jgi:hypothetical protein
MIVSLVYWRDEDGFRGDAALFSDGCRTFTC